MNEIGVNNYLKIYFWKVLSIISGFLSLLIVVPHLSMQQDLYGIYVFCISFALYLTYSDIGFLSAGQKFAAEEVAKNNKIEEVEITGFTMLLLILLFLPFTAFMLYLSVDPTGALSDLDSNSQDIASELFLIIGLLLPVQVILQRFVDFVLVIRLMDYLSLKITITLNIIKIFSVYFFFKDERYLLSEYYLFITVLSILGSLISIVMIRRVINYDFILLFKSLKLSGKYYQKGKDLAFSSFALTISFILYYELDLIIIGKLFGINDIAIYAIGFTFLNFVRNLWNILYSPFTQRLNHFAGHGSTDSIKSMLSKLIEYTLPLYVILVTVILFGAETLILFWVGVEYTSSVIIIQILILSTLLGVIIRPASYYFVSCLKYKYIYIQAILLPVVFYLVIFISIQDLGMTSLAVAKLVVSLAGVLVAILGISKILSPGLIIMETLLPTCVFVFVAYLYLPNVIGKLFPDPHKDITALVAFLVFLSTVVVLSYILIIISQKKHRTELKNELSDYFYKRL